jgi:MerR family transcriptional regulator, light-induced transcriptional regulator
VAALGDDELRTLTAGPVVVAAEGAGATMAARPESPSQAPRSLLTAIERLDHAGAERELALLAAGLGARELVYRVALPLMQEVGEAWHQGNLSVAQEHMTSALLRNILGAIMPLYRRSSPAGKLLFATPSGEHHEFGILLSAMLAVGGGLGIVYLGPALPAAEIVSAAQKTAPQAVVLGFIGANGAEPGLGDVREVAQKLPARIELWVGGTRGEALIQEVRKTRALLIDDFEMLEQHLVRLGARF